MFDDNTSRAVSALGARTTLERRLERMKAMQTDDRRIPPVSIMLFVIAATFMAGCSTHHLSFAPVQHPVATKHKITVQLVEESAFCDAQYDQLGEKILLGDSLCRNAEALSSAVFESVLVERLPGEKGGTSKGANAILIPTLKSFDRDEPAFAFNEQTTTLAIRFVLKDGTNQKIIWRDTFIGEGKGAKAPGLSRKMGAQAQIGAALDDLFQKAFVAMSESIQIHDFVRQTSSTGQDATHSK